MTGFFTMLLLPLSNSWCHRPKGYFWSRLISVLCFRSLTNAYIYFFQTTCTIISKSSITSASPLLLKLEETFVFKDGAVCEGLRNLDLLVKHFSYLTVCHLGHYYFEHSDEISRFEKQFFIPFK